MEISKKPRYNMSLVLQETGIKADTLRAWEKRYQLPHPERTPGGHRLFSDFDIAIIQWLQKRQQEGMRISKAVGLWRDIEEEGLNPLEYHSPNQEVLPDQSRFYADTQPIEELTQRWVDACLEFDEDQADYILNRAFAQFQLETVCVNLILPALTQIGESWYQGLVTVQQEHFASELVSKKIQALIAAAPIPNQSNHFLIGCPEGESHTISSLMLSLIIRYQGYGVTYLGGNVPLNQLSSTVQKIAPSLVIMSATRLSSAASLARSARLLSDHNIPLAYGGWIFSQIEDLQRLLPGYFLGYDLIQATSKAIHLVDDPSRPPEITPADTSFVDLIPAFQFNKSKIEYSVTNKLKDVILSPQMQVINDHLGDTIIAALALGDLDLIRYDLGWAEGLMANHGIPADHLKLYLTTYRDACDASLGYQGEQISDWLDGYLKNIEWSDK